MEIIPRTGSVRTVRTPLLVLAIHGSPQGDAVFRALDEALSGALGKVCREEGFKGQAGQQVQVTPLADSGVSPRRIVLVGQGTQAKAAARQVRTLAYRAGNMAREAGLTSFTVVAPDRPAGAAEEVARWLTEGAAAGIYRYDHYYSGDRRPRKAPRQATLLWCREAERPLARGDQARLAEAVGRGQASAEAQAFVRDLVNAPPNELYPERLADEATQLAQVEGVKVVVLGPTQLEQKGMSLLTAVGQASRRPPRFIHVTYTPPVTAKGRIVLVGKGITFDSGGLSLKPTKGMTDMKADMGGAATVLGALQAVARWQLPWEVHGLVPAAENMPGGRAYRPGDVVRTRDGKSVEVLNTDAEGRLILADALSYAIELSPKLVIDYATLTGACMVALGPYRAALFGSQSGWTDRYAAAAERAGEPLWPLPLAEELAETLRSDIADVRNVGGSWGGAITAALFLQEFVGRTPWLHLDIAGPAYLEKPFAFYPKGGTGYGVLTLLEFLQNQSK
jgi:leucyl aminopeptidase